MIFGNDSKAIPLYQSLSIDFQKNIQSYLVGFALYLFMKDGLNIMKKKL